MQRDTRQRRAIRQVFDQCDDPLSAGDILARGQKQLPQLSLATVYRNINALVDDGEIRPVELPGRPPCYEKAGKHHHHHFVCRKCDRVFEIHGCVAGVNSLAPEGFTADGHEIILYGNCPDCRTGNPEKGKKS